MDEDESFKGMIHYEDVISAVDVQNESPAYDSLNRHNMNFDH